MLTNVFAPGFKNSLKGAGYFLGAATVSWSYNGALGVLLALIGLALPGSLFLLSSDLGKSTGKKQVTLNDVFRMNYNINVLSAARLFLFGSRHAPDGSTHVLKGLPQPLVSSS